MTIQRAIISWLRPEDGGRAHPPTGPRYCAPARFEDDGDYSLGAWSLVVEFQRVFKNQKHVLAEVRFLVDEAPHHLLHDGSRFDLMEGKKRVARGIILPPAVNVPDEINDFEAALIG